MRLDEVIGTFYMRVVFRHEGGIAELYEGMPAEIALGDAADRTRPPELAIELDELVIPRPGVYELLIYANYVSLHAPDGLVPVPFPPVRVVVLPADGSPGGVL